MKNNFCSCLNRNKNITIIIIINLSLLIACSKKIQLPPHHVDVIKVTTKDVPYVFDYSALISGVEDFQVIPRVGGIIVKQLYKEGSLVQKDQALYQIDPRPYENQLQADMGQLEKDQTASVQYKAILDRYNKLYPIGGVSKQDLDTATVNYYNALGLTKTDLANISNDKLNLEYCLVKAPTAGLISERLISSGAMISAYQTILNNINSQSNLYINFSMPELDRLMLINGIKANKINIPKDYQFSVDIVLLDGTTLKNIAVVKFVDTRLNPQNGSWNLRANLNVNNKIKQNMPELLAGGYVHVYLNGTIFKNAVAIPQASIFYDNNGAFVYLLDKKNQVKKQPITTGVMIDDMWIINNGLKIDDIVVSSGGIKIQEHDTVVIDSLK